MNRVLTKLNLLGVIVLVVLCICQWRENSRLHLDRVQLQKTVQTQTTKITEHEQAIKNTTTDLDGFRDQLTSAIKTRREADEKLAAAETQLRQLTADETALKNSVTNWTAAVAARDAQIKKANVELQKLGEERNATVVKYNELAAKYNTVVKDLNAERAKAAAPPAPKQP